MLAQLDFLAARDISAVCFHDGFNLVRHDCLLVSYCFSYKKAKIANSLIGQEKFKFYPLFFKMFTKSILIDDAIAPFKLYPGIADESDNGYLQCLL